MSDCCVVKVGGSLFDLPDLRQRMQRFLGDLDAQRVLLVPGGGAAADVVRALDRVHGLGEEASHWLALQAMSVNARFLGALLPEAPLVSLACASGSDARLLILDALPFFQADEANPAHLPHRWQVTSDSLAVRAAALFGARELILMKSVSWPGSGKAISAEIVDGYFAQALATVPQLRVRIVNLREGKEPRTQ